MPIIKIKVVSTIAAFEKEIKMQIKFVKNFIPLQPIPKQNQIIFCGTGDSFVSAKLGEVFSDFKIQAFDPLELLANKKLLRKKKLYLISISGNTISNIKLAKAYRNTVAITANKQSRLAKKCNGIIPLNFENTAIQTVGSISFLASALTCISLVTRFSLKDAHYLFCMADRVAKKISLSGTVFVLGNYWSYPVAMYCVAKLYETLGLDAHYERIEEFSHMGLFSCKKGDTILVFEKKNSHNQKLLAGLKRYGLNAMRIDPPSLNKFNQVLFFIFVSQLLALYSAKKKRKKDCFFVEQKKLRDTSSAMIY
jgi:fructoselysine-6-P-deglycase FrlB-like protein